MKIPVLLQSFLSLIFFALLNGTAIAQPTANEKPSGTNATEFSELIRKHTRIVSSTKDQPAPLSSEQLILVLGQIILNPTERALLPQNDLQVLEQIPGRRDRRFVEAERAALGAICGRVQNPGRLDFTDVAEEFDTSRDDNEKLLLRFYQDAIKDLSLGTQRLVQAKLSETASQVTFVQTTVNLFELSVESPQLAEKMLTGGCKRYEESLKREPLRDITLLEELKNAQQFAPIIVESK